MSVARVTAAIRSVRKLGALGTGTSSMDQRTEHDSHANTSVVGKESALLIHDYETPDTIPTENGQELMEKCVSD